ncbi:glycosyltransferase [Plantactinospora mayteni]|uniref:glycosyltransferase n=1 Tax=Plantactinospora mayteni TaxID=566021 RepID=UPI00194286F7|nr:glycosyltransferase [Plantactinospora mayteni]
MILGECPVTGVSIPVTLLGFTVPDEAIEEILARDAAMPVQTHTFAWGLVRALIAGGCHVTLLSAMPVSTYPRHPRIRFRGRRFDADGVQGRLLGFLNLLGAKHATRFLAVLLVGWRATGRWGTQVLLIHGIHTPFLWFGVLLAAIRGTLVVPVLTDPPTLVGPGEGRPTRLLRGLDAWLVRAALRRCDGVIALTAALAEDFAPGRRHLVLEGIYSPARPESAGSIRSTSIRSSRRRETYEIAYAGSLTRTYGVDRLVEAVRQIDQPSLRLSIFGRGELEPWIAEQAAADSRIRHPRLLGRDELLHRLASADLLVNPRPVDQDFVRYSFPSKLIEYLSVGVPVVTTRLPGIPGDYRGRVVFAESDTAEGLAAAIRSVLSWRPGEAAEFGVAAAAFIGETRGVRAQGTKLAAFIRELARTNRRPARSRTSVGVV